MSADLGPGRAERPHHVAAGVDREGLAAGHAAQVRLVLRFDPATPIWLPCAIALVRVGGEIAGRDVAHVAKDLRPRVPPWG